MAKIRPFRGLRYSPVAGNIATLVAPPYDVISSDEREVLAGRNEHNVVLLTLPEQKDDDRSKFVKYARSSALLEEWRRSGALALESVPSYYRYRQVFSLPGRPETFSRLSLIATIKVEPYSKGVVLPHEQTFPKHKEDRLRILEATRSHLECIYGLYEDDDKAVLDLLQSVPAELVIQVSTDDGVEHSIERVDSPAATASLSQAIENKKVWIADGHHRYETACAFREMQGEREGEIAEDYMMMALSSISDPGLVLLPTHRILNPMTLDLEGLRSRVAEQFEYEEVPNVRLMNTIELIDKGGKRAFGVALPGGTGWVLTVRDLDKLVAEIKGTSSDRLKSLDVSILHDYIFARLMGLNGHEFFGYTRDPAEAIASVEDGAPAAFLMNPPTVDDMRQIALGGEKMPQKSTYYYPKILSGLVLWSLNDYNG